MKQYKLTNEEIVSMTLALSHLIHAGIGTGDALTLLKEDEKSPAFRGILEAMACRTDEGQPLAAVFRDAGCFPNYVCTLLEVGERVGRPEETLASLAVYYQGRARLQRQLQRTLLYPAVLLAVLLTVVAVLLTVVLPVFNDVYAQLGGQLTGFAGWLLALGMGLKALLPAFLWVGLAAAAVLLIPPVRRTAGRAYLRLFGDRGVLRGINNARFVQALTMAMGSGMTASEAVRLATSLSDVPGFQKRCRICTEAVDGGQPLSRALSEADLLERAQCRLLEAGERSGRSDTVLTELSRQLLEKSEDALEQAAGRVEPAVVGIACVLIGGVLLSVMIPLMNIMSAIG